MAWPPIIFKNNTAPKAPGASNQSLFPQVTNEESKQKFLQIPDKIGKFGLDILRAFPRAATTVGMSIAEPIAKKVTGVPLTPEQEQFVPQTKFEKTVFGPEPVNSFKKRVDVTTEDLVKISRNPEYTRQQSKIAAPVLVFGGLLGDLFPAGGEEAFVKQLAGATKADEVIKILKGSNVADDIAKKIAPEIAATADPVAIRTILDSAPVAEKSAPKIKQLPYNEAEYQDFLNKTGLTDESYRNKLREQGFSDIALQEKVEPVKPLATPLVDEANKKFPKVQAVEDALERAKNGEVFDMRADKIAPPVEEAVAKETKPRRLPFTPEQKSRIDELASYRDFIGEQLKDSPGAKLKRFISQKEGEFLDIEYPDPKNTPKRNEYLRKRNEKLFKAARSAFEGTPYSDQFDDPDVIRDAIERYNKIKEDYKQASDAITSYKKQAQGELLAKADEDFLNRVSAQAGKQKEKLVAEANRLKERQKAFAEGVKRAKEAENRKITQAQGMEEAIRQEDEPLNFFQKIYAKLFPVKGKNLDNTTKEALRTWERKRIKAPILAEKEMGSINVPRGEGLKTILDYQAGRGTKYREAIQKKFDALFNEAESRGLRVDYRENYLPQVYKESTPEIKEKVRQYLAGRGLTDAEIDGYLAGRELPKGVASNLKMSPFFTKDRIFPDYKTAMEWGLTPRFTDLDQLAAYYRDQLEKTVANKELLDDLIATGKLMPEQAGVPANWIPVQHLPLGQRGYFASPRIADVLDGMFKNGEELSPGATAASFIASISRGMQELALSAGIPKSSVNFFTIGQTIKEITAGNLKAVPIFFRSSLNDASIKYFAKNAEYLEKMANQGIDLGGRVGNYSKVYDNWANTFRDTALKINKPGSLGKAATYKQVKALFGEGFDKVFNEKTFGSFMPQLYTQTFKDEYLAAIKNGLGENEAAKLAGDITKKMYGMVESLGRSKVTSDTLTSVFFAPKFRESVINVLYNTGEAGYDFVKQLGGLRGDLNPSLKRNRKLLAGMIVSYGLYNALNYKLNGHFMWDNPSGRQFALRVPTKNGDVVYVEFMPSFLAFGRNLANAGIALAKGDVTVAKQKLSSLFSMPVQLTANLIGNYDYFGNPIYKDTDTGWQKAKKLAAYLGLQVNHPYIKEVVNQIQDKKPLYQSVTNALELPLKFSSESKEATNNFYRSLEKVAKENARSNEKIKPVYNHVQDLINEGKTGEAQAIVDGLTDEEYEAYKRVRASDKARATKSGEAKMFNTVLKVRQLVINGRTEEAQAIIDNLDDEEYRLYKLAKERLPASEQY